MPAKQENILHESQGLGRFGHNRSNVPKWKWKTIPIPPCEKEYKTYGIVRPQVWNITGDEAMKLSIEIDKQNFDLNLPPADDPAQDQMFRRLRQGQEAIDLALALGQPHNLNLELALAPPMLEDQPASQQVGGEVGPNGEGGNPENPEIERIARRLQIYQSCQSGTTDLQISLTTEFSERRQIFLWIASFASFAVKVPMVPVHIWSPEAHVEAPTAGSVILAGIPSKLGTHGFLRFSIPMFPEATLRSTPFIYTPSAIAIIYTPSTTSRQIDLKKIIAHSPVAHMNLVTIGMSSRAAAVRSPILSYGHTRPKHVCRACDPSTY
ncbi:hypothetical protein NE237_022066 [Protea cynaroides]|uniref:NADH-ubiquinone oxidoreductase chain 4 n=1 Tax=Protea cynaroides TaxID=273540 RepID=A0A9Q0GNE0_9MAGN|nr:hypothetical protein NE237_022066 [Protea cynaroides]